MGIMWARHIPEAGRRLRGVPHTSMAGYVARGKSGVVWAKPLPPALGGESRDVRRMGRRTETSIVIFHSLREEIAVLSPTRISL